MQFLVECIALAVGATVILGILMDSLLFQPPADVLGGTTRRLERFKDSVGRVRGLLAGLPPAEEGRPRESVAAVRQSFIQVRDESHCMDFETYKQAMIELDQLRADLESEGIDVSRPGDRHVA